MEADRIGRKEVVKLTVLGSAAAVMNLSKGFRYSSCHLLEVGDKKILLDAGVGVMPQLAKLGLSMADIDIIVISHFHQDHFAIGPLMQDLFLHGFKTGEKPRVTICGPNGIEDACRTTFGIGFDYESYFVKNTDTNYVDFGENQSVTFGTITISGFKTKHYDFEAGAVRIESEGKVLAYSGDSSDDPGLRTAADKADLFLCEAATDVGADTDPGHLSAFEAAKVAEEMQAKKIVLTHYSGNDTDTEMINSAKSSGYQGEVAVSYDLSSYEF